MNRRNYEAVEAESSHDIPNWVESHFDLPHIFCLISLASSKLTRYQNYSRTCILPNGLSSSLKADEAAAMILAPSRRLRCRIPSTRRKRAILYWKRNLR